MEYQKVINLLDDTINQPSKFRTRYWFLINDESRGTYKASNQIKFKTSIKRSHLCEYSDACILVSGTITIDKAAADDAAKRADENYENCAPFTECISR